LDTTFQANVWWGGAYGFLPLEDGRVYAAGLFRVEGLSDTLHLVRFMPDGSLDPTFNNLLKFRVVETTASMGAVANRIHSFGDDRLIITGAFELADGEPRRGICMVDTSGQLSMDAFVDAGCGNYNYNGFIHGSMRGIIPAPEGNYYIWGAYHGYDDGTTNDPQQRFISRLHGPHVGVQEVLEQPVLRIFPNPAQEQVTFEFERSRLGSDASISVRDALGREVYRQRLSGREHPVVWDTRAVPDGSYIVTLLSGKGPPGSEKLIIQR